MNELLQFTIEMHIGTARDYLTMAKLHKKDCGFNSVTVNNYIKMAETQISMAERYLEYHDRKRRP